MENGKVCACSCACCVLQLRDDPCGASTISAPVVVPSLLSWGLGRGFSGAEFSTRQPPSHPPPSWRWYSQSYCAVLNIICLHPIVSIEFTLLPHHHDHLHFHQLTQLPPPFDVYVYVLIHVHIQPLLALHLIRHLQYPFA